ncbi:hypothetical protein WJX73_000651 [Symbiochloris irregularis]|uniref:Uncharacterized protein n=1 Tax=Symbiochloris irregularis TaxID=706552 RepID=A0AAW1NXZ7_9CHLO
MSMDNPGFLDRFYPNVTGFPFPLGPLFSRKTLRYEVVPASIWIFEQEQSLALSGVSTTVRMTVVRLQSTGGLFVYSPIAPTKECINLVKELGGEVEYIILSTFAYEHKIYVPPFNRAFPDAQVWVAPGQWSAPIPLPLPLLGIFPTGRLEGDDSAVPFGDELEHRTLCASVGIQQYSEVAFFHKATQTLILTDAVVYVPGSPPEVVDERSLLGAGGDLPAIVLPFSSGDIDKPANKLNPPPPREPERKLRGWKRNSLNVLYIIPSNLLFPDDSFAQITSRLFVSPILKLLVFSKAPQATWEWVQQICDDWDFRQVIPAHFEAPVPTSPSELRAAFTFLRPDAEDSSPVPQPRQSVFSKLLGGLGRKGAPAESGSPFPEADISALKSAEKFLQKVGVLNKV